LENFVSYVKKSGTWSTVVVSALLAFNYWGVLDLSKIPYGHTVDILYGYLIVGIIGILPLLRKRRPEVDKLCPVCDSPLQSRPQYSCPECGDIKFEKGA